MSGSDGAATKRALRPWVLGALVLGPQLLLLLLKNDWIWLGDFALIHGAARHVVEGAIASAYRLGSFLVGGEVRDTLWAYPPPFNLLIAPLGLMTLPIAYVVFLTATLGAYVLLLDRLAPDARGARLLLLAMTPVSLSVVWTGQTGFVTGSLVALFVLLHRRGSPWAGVPLGVMIIKPHLVLGVGLLLLLSRDWRSLGVAAATAAALAALSALVFGMGIWPDFLAALRLTSERFASGEHPFSRTLSLYGTLRSFGVAHASAVLLHAALAAIGLAAVVAASFRNWSFERRLAVAIAASLTFSPYAYDYDGAILGVSIALLARELGAAPRWLRATVVAMCWIAGGFAVARFAVKLSILRLADEEAVVLPPITLAGLALAVLLGSLWSVANGTQARGLPGGRGHVASAG